MSDNDAIAFLINELVEERAQKRAYAEVLDKIATALGTPRWTTLNSDCVVDLRGLVQAVWEFVEQRDDLAKAAESQAPDEAVPHPSPFGTVIGNAKDKEPAPPASDSDE